MSTTVEWPEGPIHQASAIPFRCHEGTVQFCLITSSSGRRWVFPKGLIDPGDTYQETALNEAHEEAGLRGVLSDEPLGFYVHHKWGTDLTVVVMLMEVTEVDDHWLEEDFRTRRWAPADEARRLLTVPRLHEALNWAVVRLGRHAP